MSAPYEFDPSLSLMQGIPLAWIDRNGVTRVDLYGPPRRPDPMQQVYSFTSAALDLVRSLIDFDEDRDYEAVEDCPDCGWCDLCARNHHDPCSREDVW